MESSLSQIVGKAISSARDFWTQSKQCTSRTDHFYERCRKNVCSDARTRDCTSRRCGMDEIAQTLNQAGLAGAYRKGERVELHSLKGAAEHNGKCGTVVGRQGERLQVRLDDAKTLALKVTNIRKLVAMPDATAMRRAFAELSAAEKKANAALPPGAGMENPCAVCGGARNDEFLPCCGVSVCSGCSLAASMRPVPCGKCGGTIPSQPTDLLDAYARLAAAGHEGARRSGLTLATMLKVPEATRRQFASAADKERCRASGLTESEGAAYVAQCLREGRAPNIDTARAFYAVWKSNTRRLTLSTRRCPLTHWLISTQIPRREGQRADGGRRGGGREGAR